MSSAPLLLLGGRNPQLRHDLAYDDQIDLVGSFGGGSGARVIVVPGDYWLQIISLQAGYTPLNNTNPRTPYLQVEDSTGTALLQVPSVAGQQNAVLNTYVWMVGAGQAFGSLNMPQVMPWPSLLIPSGYAVRMTSPFVLIGDFQGPVHAFVRKVPTGPDLGGELLSLPLPLAG